MSKPKPPEPYEELKLRVQPQLKRRLEEYCRLKQLSFNAGCVEMIDLSLKVRGL